MSTVLLARTVLAVVLITAGTAKIGNWRRTRATLHDFGVPTRLSTAFAWLLPVAELACGLAFIPHGTARWGAVGAVALFIVFLGAIVWNLVRGRRPECRCFGHLGSAPIGWGIVVRNLALTGLAVLVVVQPAAELEPLSAGWLEVFPPGHPAWPSLFVALGAGTVLGVQGWLLGNLARQQGRLLLRLDAVEARLQAGETGDRATAIGLPRGQPAPAFTLPALGGGLVSLDQLLARGRDVLLLFMDPGCGPCRSLLPEVAGWRRDGERGPTVVMLSRGSVEENRARFGSHEVEILLDADEVAERYHALATPSAVLVDLRGRIASPVAQGADAIRRLRAEVAVRPASTAAVRRVPVPAPAVATLGLVGACALLTAASPTAPSRGGGWPLEVHDGHAWRTWWRPDSAPEAWPGPSPLVLGATVWRQVAPGAELGELVVSGGGAGLRTRIVLARYDPRRFRVLPVMARAPAGRATWTIDSAGPAAVFALNAGQFSGGSPWGWLVSAGRELQPPGRGPLSMAVAVTAVGEHRFVSPESLAVVREAGETREAFQSYPALLVDDGRVPGPLRSWGPLDLGHRDARLALGVQRDGRVLVALTRFDNLGRIFGALPIGLTLPEMAAVMGALGCRRAVGLDGGLSAQLLARPEGEQPLRWTGNRAVPLGLEVVALQ